MEEERPLPGMDIKRPFKPFIRAQKPPKTQPKKQLGAPHNKSTNYGGKPHGGPRRALFLEPKNIPPQSYFGTTTPLGILFQEN